MAVFDEFGNWVSDAYDASVNWTADQIGNTANTYESAVNWTSDQIEAAADWTSSQWRDAVARWESAVADYNHQLAVHASLRDAAAALGELDTWQAQQDRADAIRSTITNLSSALSQISTWARQAVGLAGLNSMGALPLVPVAVIVGSIAAVAAVTAAVYSYDNQLAAKWDYIKAHPNATPTEVAAVLNAGGSPFSLGTGNLGMWIVIAGAIIVFGPEIMKQLNKRH